MISGKYNMICAQGATFSKRLTWTIDDVPVDLSTYTARMQAKTSYGATCTAIFDITTENGGITLDDKGALVRFKQRYESDTFNGTSQKRLRLASENGRWVITDESVD